ncbi:DUF4760 domain-containing protein [Actinoplanes regularis]|uniref:DUF4760 domain-containing protein n=1 Tax=Actinoplanes regularis TaxID=52697 RepID=UPI002553DC0F|nr:hypothetical protein [Actinoplanes regularis]
MVSVAALVISVAFGRRQMRQASSYSTAQVAMEMLTRESRSELFMESEDYIIHRLAKEHSPEQGVLALPLNIRKHVQRIAYYYSDLAILTIYGGVSQDLVVTTVHRPVVRAWTILEPYIEAERRKLGSDRYFNFFEHLASICATADVVGMHNRLGLRTFDKPVAARANPDAAQPPDATTAKP